MTTDDVERRHSRNYKPSTLAAGGSDSTATSDADGDTGGSIPDTAVVLEQSEALKLLLRQVMRHYVKVSKAADEEKQRAFALSAVFKELIAVSASHLLFRSLTVWSAVRGTCPP